MSNFESVCTYVSVMFYWEWNYIYIVLLIFLPTQQENVFHKVETNEYEIN